MLPLIPHVLEYKTRRRKIVNLFISIGGRESIDGVEESVKERS